MNVICIANVNIDGVLEEIQNVPSQFSYNHPGSPKYWSGIPIRNSSGTMSELGIQLNHTLDRLKGIMKPCKNTIWLSEKMPNCSRLLNDIKNIVGELFLVRALTVNAHGFIAEHSDGHYFSLKNGNLFRLHVPIQTNSETILNVDGHEYHLELGSLYLVDVDKLHSIRNNGNTNRIHLVIDIHRNTKLIN